MCIKSVTNIVSWVVGKALLVWLSTFILPANAVDKIEVVLEEASGQIQLNVGEAPTIALDTDVLNTPINITHLFGQGSNILRVRAFNSDLYRKSFSMRILLNDTVLYTAACDTDASPCGSYAGTVPAQFAPPKDTQLTNFTVRHDTYFDDFYQIIAPDLSPLRPLTVSYPDLAEDEVGYIYINDIYTGHTIAEDHTFMLPDNNYRIGVGVFKKTAKSGPAIFKRGTNVKMVKLVRNEYHGRFYEKNITLSSNAIDILMTEQELLPLQHQTKIAVVPVKRTIGFTDDNVYRGHYELDERYVSRFVEMLKETSSAYAEPLSFGLNAWDVTLYPTVTDTTIAAHDAFVDVASFLDKANLSELNDQYEVVALLFNVEGVRETAVAGGGYIYVHQKYLDDPLTKSDSSGKPILTKGTAIEQNESELPNEVIYHEMLHLYEQWNVGRLNFWNGVDQLHGYIEHGYESEKIIDISNFVWSDFMEYYIPYVQGRVVETKDMYFNFNFPEVPDCLSDCDYTGIFPTVRRGMGNVHLKDSSGGVTEIQQPEPIPSAVSQSVVRFIYFIEKGQAFEPAVFDALKAHAFALQQYWYEQFGGTFYLYDQVVDVMYADHDDEWYVTTPDFQDDERWFRLGNIRDEVYDKLDIQINDPKVRVINYPTTQHNGRVGAGYGGAWMDGDDLRCLIGENNGYNFPFDDGTAAHCMGHVAHEFGHLYGLQHTGLDDDCMQFGFYDYSTQGRMCSFGKENRQTVKSHAASAAFLAALPGQIVTPEGFVINAK